MKNIVYTDTALCIGCNRCSRECAFPIPNHTYLSETNQIKVQVDTKYCISCGACINVCAHSARLYEDDLEEFLSELKRGTKITLFLAPSFMTNFKEYKKYISYFRSLGINFVYDVSLGASICIWSHLKYLEKYPNKKYITQPCPSILSYAKKYNPKLLEHFIPIKTPIGSLATYIKSLGNKEKIAAITPCIAKKWEAEQTKLFDYNITFESIIKLTKKIDINSFEDSNFDSSISNLGSIFPIPGGLKENIEFFNDKLHIENIEGNKVYLRLNQYLDVPYETRPDILDVLNCSDGCNFGPLNNKTTEFYQSQKTMYNYKSKIYNDKNIKKEYLSLFKSFDETLKLEDYIFKYSDDENLKLPVASIGDIEDAFSELEKFTFEERNINCGSCGSESCLEMAKKLVYKSNIKENCIMLTKNILIKEKNKEELLLNKTNKYIALIKEITKTLEAYHEALSYRDNIKKSLNIVSLAYNNSSIYLIDKVKDTYINNISFNNFSSLTSKDEETLLELFPKLIDSSDNDVITYNYNTNKEKLLFLSDKIKSFCIIKIHMNGNNYGYFFEFNNLDIVLTKDDLNVLISIGTLIFSKNKEYQMSLELSKSRELANSLSKTKTEFLSKMSHEFKTPLNAIIGMTTASTNTNDSDKLHHYLSNISYSSEHLLGIINDILDYSTIENNKLILNKQVFGIEDLVKKIDSLFSSSFLKKNQIFKIYLGYNIDRFYVGDYFRITQIISNLVSNANKFTREFGTVKLSFESEILDFETVNLKIEVIDNGIGMNKKQLSNLFTPFFQENMDNSIVSFGAGLGLSIAKGLVASMEGSIEVDSIETKGSTFKVYLPLKRHEQVKNNLASFFNQKDILMFSDDRTIISNNLDTEIFRSFDITSDTDTLLRKLSNYQYDLIIIDFECNDIINSIKKLSQYKNKIICLGNMLSYQKYESIFKENNLTNHINYPIVNDSFIDSIYKIFNTINEVNEENINKTFLNKTILLVDDVELNREVVKYLLEDTLINIDCASDGEEGYLKFYENQKKYCLILMDIQMPKLNGYEATEKIRQLGTLEAKNIPIIAITANTYQSDIDKSISVGMNEHLGKPIDRQVLIRTMSKYIK